MRCGFYAGRVDWTRDISHVPKSQSHGINMSGYIPWSAGWFLVPRTLPRVLRSLSSLFFYRYSLQYFVVCARKMLKDRTPNIRTFSCARGARPPDRPDSFNPMKSASTPRSELAMQSPAPGSLAGPPPAASPQLGRWICRQGLRSARIRGLLLALML